MSSIFPPWLIPSCILIAWMFDLVWCCSCSILVSRHATMTLLSRIGCFRLVPRASQIGLSHLDVGWFYFIHGPQTTDGVPSLQKSR